MILTDGYPRRPRERRGAGRRRARAGHRDRGDRHRRGRPRLPPPAGQQRAGVDLRPERASWCRRSATSPGSSPREAAPCGCCHDRDRRPHPPIAPPASPRPAGPGEPPPGLRPGPGRGPRGALRAVPLRRAGPGRVGLRPRRPGRARHRRLDRLLPERLRAAPRRRLAEAGPGGRPGARPAAAVGGAIGLVAGRGRDRRVPGRPAGPCLLLGGARAGHRPGPGAGRPVAAAPGLRPDRRRPRRVRRRLLFEWLRGRPGQSLRPEPGARDRRSSAAGWACSWPWSSRPCAAPGSRS